MVGMRGHMHLLLLIIYSLCNFTRTDPPVAMVDAEFRFAEGKTATLSCSTESLPAPVSIKWTNKDSEELLLEETPNPSNPLELILPNVTREESGEYICTVSNELSSGEATTTLVVLCEFVCLLICLLKCLLLSFVCE